MPPSTGNRQPVMLRAASDASSTATAATSSTVFGRLIADSAQNSSDQLVVAAEAHGDRRVGPGGAHDVGLDDPRQHGVDGDAERADLRAADFTSPFTACFVAAYPAMPGLPSLPSTDDVTMIRPSLAGIMCCSARRMPQNTWLRFQSISSDHSSSVIWAIGAVFSTPPELRQHDVELSVALDGEVDQPLDGRLLRRVAADVERRRCRRAAISSRQPAPFASSRPLTTTEAPSAMNASAMPRPMLRVPPVMHATFPSSLLPCGRLLASSVGHQYGDVPPSIEIIEPVIPAPASEASSTATAATSSHLVEPLDRRLLGEHVEQALVGRAPSPRRHPGPRPS